jgi:hypothetical protein
MEFNILRLNLRAPLFYLRDKALDPFGFTALIGEYLFCFEVNPGQGFRIDPSGETYLGALICGGKADPVSPGETPRPDPSRRFELPAGTYFFSQARELLGREDIINMAMEVQKEGLWERLHPEPRLYLRYLFEDQAPVTQVFRPFV